MDEIFINWRDSLKAKQRKRSYEHFDEQLDLDNEEHFKRVQRAIRTINTHEFLPFIKFIKKDIRYRKGENGLPERKLKERPIMYASHLDAHIYSFYSYGWSVVYEEFLQNNDIATSVIAYRKITDEGATHTRNKNNIQFAESVFRSIQEMGDSVVIVADITKFFDTLNHKVLKDQLCKVLDREKLLEDEYKVFRSLTSYRYVLKDQVKKDLGKKSEYAKLILKIVKKIKKEKVSIAQAVYECGRDSIKSNMTTVGIPQGSPASGLLANIYLATFDAGFRQKFPNVIYRRYSDDIVLVCPEGLANDVFSFLKESLHKSSLAVNPSKVNLARFQRNTDGSVLCVEVKNGAGTTVGRKYLDYLGFEFNGQSVLLRGRTLQRAYRKGDKKISKFYERQTEENPRKPHKLPKHKANKAGTYIENAMRTMQVVGSKINSQEKKMTKFIRRKRKDAKEGL